MIPGWAYFWIPQSAGAACYLIVLAVFALVGYFPIWVAYPALAGYAAGGFLALRILGREADKRFEREFGRRR